MKDFRDESERLKIQHVRKAINSHIRDIRDKNGLLKHQSALGLGILIISILGIVISSFLYITDHISWWLCVLVNAVLISLTQEIEHDLIHQLYFPKNPFMHHLMMALSWVARPSTTNPWVRRKLHLKHHQLSGTEEDLEERALTNGFRWSAFRIYMMADLMVASTMLMLQTKTWKGKLQILWIGFKSYFPITLLTWFLWYVFIVFHLINLFFSDFFQPVMWPDSVSTFMHYLDIVTVILIAPNVLWTFCLHFISSNMHYYGDIERGNIIQETQVFNAWWLWPVHVFCFNFGSTHGIHHFVVSEPFYIRQMSAGFAHKVMKEAGVRFNDFGTFLRANRWS